MILEVFAVAVAAGGGLMVALGASQRSALARTWVAAAERCRLTGIAVRRRFGGFMHLEGGRGPLQVRLQMVRLMSVQQPATRIVVQGLPLDLELRLEDPDDPVSQARRRRRQRLGDERFDQDISIDGSRLQALALLDAASRDRARAIFLAGVPGIPRLWSTGSDIAVSATLSRGRLTVDRYAGYRPEVLAQALEEVLVFAEGLLAPLPIEEKAAANVRDDPEPGIRLNNLRELLAVSPSHPATDQALRAAAADGDEQVQLEAAIALGFEGRATLLEIASREWSGDACAARAIQALRSALPVEQARMLLARALRARRPETAAACAESLSRRTGEDVETFLRMAGLERGIVAVAAARALGRVGGLPALAVLRELRDRLSDDDEVQRAVREAIGAVQARTSGALPGQLSIADEDPSGQVSLTSGAAGRVAVAPALDPPDRES